MDGLLLAWYVDVVQGGPLPVISGVLINLCTWPYKWVNGVISYNPSYRGYNPIYNC